MVKELQQFKILDANTMDVVIIGSAAECCEKICVTDSTLRKSIARNNYLCGGKYLAVRISDGEELAFVEKARRAGDDSVAAAWDAFCEPIREKYNIPVYKAKTEVRG